MTYGSWDIKHNRQSFLTFYPTKTQKTKILKTKKQKQQQQQQQKRLELSSSFYTSAPKNHNCYFLFWAFFICLPPKIKIKKNWKKKKKKKNLGISSFYTSEPKSWSYATLFLRYGVGQIVIIFHFRLFFALLPQHQKSKF